MGLLKPVENTTAFVKFGIMGLAGSGKTFTSVELAMGIAKMVGSKSIAFFDTEKGSDFHVDRVKASGLEFLGIKSRSFVDLLKVIEECEDQKVGVLIIDSISHVWRDVVEGYLNAKGRKFISLPDWGVLKGEWARFTDAYVNSNLHIIMCGRAADVYDTVDNEDTGKKESIKVGVKMRGESEMGYEPDILIHMERTSLAERSKGKKKNSQWIHQATILKDRTDLMNGKVIDNPEFKDFLPIINALKIGGKHVGSTSSTATTEMFRTDGQDTWERKQRDKEIALETLKEQLTLMGLDGTSKDERLNRTRLIVSFFGTASPTHIEKMVPTPQIQRVVEELKKMRIENTLQTYLENLDAEGKPKQTQK